MIDSSESQACVEVHLLEGFWWPLGTLTTVSVGEWYLKLAVGRAYHDCTPTRDVCQGTHT
jgi:hypothetical protein